MSVDRDGNDNPICKKILRTGLYLPRHLFYMEGSLSLSLSQTWASAQEDSPLRPIFTTPMAHGKAYLLTRPNHPQSQVHDHPFLSTVLLFSYAGPKMPLSLSASEFTFPNSAHSHLDPPTLPNVTDGHSLIPFLWPSLDPQMRTHTLKKQHISIWHLWFLVYHYFFIIIFLKAHTSFGKDTNLFLSAFKLLNFLSFPMLLGKVC